MSHYKILIVDDSRTVHAELNFVLSEINFENENLEIEQAYGYEDFRKIFVPEKYALVMTDLVMEKDDSGIDVINHIRHTCNDSKTRIVLMTANPEKIPPDILTRDYDINAYIDKNKTSDFMTKLTVISMLKTYKDMCSLEKAMTSLEKIVKEAPEMNLSELLINAFFQVRTFLSLRDSKLNITSQIFVNGERIFPPKNIRIEKQYFPNQYSYKISIRHNVVKFYLYTSRELRAFESAYVNSLLNNIENAFIQKEEFDVEDEFVLMISKLVEARSEETGEHVNRVSEIARLLAQLSGHNSRDVKLIHGAAALHDIGKVGIPDYILNKPAKLDDKEFAIMKEHTLIGFELLRNSSLKIFQLGAVIALEHHERWDGTGYPYGLEGEQITLESRIAQIADVFEALTHDRCYRPAWSLEKAIEYMNDMKGKQFDPWLIELFNRHLRDFVQIVQDRQSEDTF